MEWKYLLSHENPNPQQPMPALTAVMGQTDKDDQAVNKGENGEFPKYVKISSGDESCYLKPDWNMNPRKYVYIPAKYLKKVPKDSIVNVAPTKARIFYFRNAWQYIPWRWMIIGAAMAVIGFGIDGSLALGDKGFVWIPITKDFKGLLLVISPVLKIAGVLAVSYKGFIDTK